MFLRAPFPPLFSWGGNLSEDAISFLNFVFYLSARHHSSNIIELSQQTGGRGAQQTTFPRMQRSALSPMLAVHSLVYIMPTGRCAI